MQVYFISEIKKTKNYSSLTVWRGIYAIQNYLRIIAESLRGFSRKMYVFARLNQLLYCGRQGEPAILVSILLLRMHGTYVASFVWTTTEN